MDILSSSSFRTKLEHRYYKFINLFGDYEKQSQKIRNFIVGPGIYQPTLVYEVTAELEVVKFDKASGFERMLYESLGYKGNYAHLQLAKYPTDILRKGYL